jgi:hypothetical protein
LTQALKKQVKELKFDLGEKIEEIEAMKRNIKITKISELDIEIKTYRDECIRLQRMLEDVIRSRDPLVYRLALY